ncbi:VOC family protein [Sciscionella sediminilitoris]|uniref:VOC family protein n=1 Tax=Sciscionella sediminilitoris TaxID=1445613 RepID=UPI0004DFB969|nr:VOC family protein [Sciscionella sp. SE31]
MKLTFLYHPVKDLKESVAFYRDTLGLEESWREGETTAAFKLPGSEIELMLDVPPDSGPQWKAGGFYAVESVDAFRREHPELDWRGEIEIPDGNGATFMDPAGNAVHLFDQTAAGSE